MSSFSHTEGSLEGGALQRAMRAIQKRRLTGILAVQAKTPQGERVVSATIHRGRVVQVDSATRPVLLRLGKLLIFGDYLPKGEVHKGIKAARKLNRPLGAYLVEQKKLDPQVLQELLHVQFLESLHTAMGWTEGAYLFTPETYSPRELEPPSLELSEVAQVGAWQSQEWPRLRTLMPTDRATFDKTHDGPVSQDVIETAGLGEVELRVFSLVHHSRDIVKLRALSRVESFEVCRSLGLLAHAGLVELEETGEPRQAVSAGVLGRGLVHHGVSAALILGLLLLGVWGFLERRGELRKAQTEGVELVEQDAWRADLTQSQVARIRGALGVYQARHGDYPVSLDVLVDAGILGEQDLTYPDFERPYTYRTSGDGYVLVQPKH